MHNGSACFLLPMCFLFPLSKKSLPLQGASLALGVPPWGHGRAPGMRGCPHQVVIIQPHFMAPVSMEPRSDLKNSRVVPPPVDAGNNVLDCCLRTREKPIPWRIVQDYRMQLVQDGCDIPATVFITAKGKQLCAPPQAPWVLRLREKLDASSARKVGAGPCSVHALGNGNSVGWVGSAPRQVVPVLLELQMALGTKQRSLLLPCCLGAGNVHLHGEGLG
uniref:Chemokine interleukin-8-like domain-containing protein n=1 Tax=Coturnix japonica TaxID=93934 RepID=A0A8C2T0D9_COTJA